MGTLGGNVANGDPGNDMPGLMQCLDAPFTLTGPDGTPRRDGARLLRSRLHDRAPGCGILTAVTFARDRRRPCL